VTARVESTSGEVVAAVAALTRLPVSDRDDAQPGASAFGVVGFTLGIVAAIPVALFGGLVPVPAAVLAFGVLAVATGALHLDGLADTADALVATGPAGPERARKDPAIGVAGVLAIGIVGMIEIASLASLAGSSAINAAIACVVAATPSRAVPVVVAVIGRPLVARSGSGRWFAERVTGRAAVVSLATAVLAIAAGAVVAPGIGIGGAIGLLVGVGLGWLVVRLRGQLDGDALGAGVELAFAASLFAIAAVTAALAPS
jgi:adenosylcobinamide-GDP ribazoletransferase